MSWVATSRPWITWTHSCSSWIEIGGRFCWISSRRKSKNASIKNWSTSRRPRSTRWSATRKSWMMRCLMRLTLPMVSDFTTHGYFHDITTKYVILISIEFRLDTNDWCALWCAAERLWALVCWSSCSDYPKSRPAHWVFICEQVTRSYPFRWPATQWLHAN